LHLQGCPVPLAIDGPAPIPANGRNSSLRGKGNGRNSSLHGKGLPHSAKTYFRYSKYGCSTPFLRNAFFCGLRVSPRVPNRPMQLRNISNAIQYLTIASARCRPARTHLMRPSLSSRPPSVHTAPVLRRRSMGLRSLLRANLVLAAGAALRSSWCWPRSGS
jgi:hypothetical protein